jgi:hypothetical protein
MASIGPVSLELAEIGGTDKTEVRVVYDLTASHSDIDSEQVYREVVELYGVDAPPHEDGTDDVVYAFKPATVKFSSTDTSFHRSWASPYLGPDVLDEDRDGIRFLPDEYRARVT